MKGGLTFTKRQLEVIGLIAHGCSNIEVAERLGLSVSTVRMHVDAVKKKLGAEKAREVPRLYSEQTGCNPFAIESTMAVAA